MQLQPVSSAEISILGNSLAQLIDDLPKVIGGSLIKSEALVFSLTDTGYDLLDEINSFVDISIYLRDPGRNIAPDTMYANIRQLHRTSMGVRRKIRNYISEVQLAIESSQ